MNRRQSITAMIGSMLGCAVIRPNLSDEGQKFLSGHCANPRLAVTRIDKGWEIKVPSFEKVVVLDAKTFIPYKTLNLCKVWKRKFVPDNGKSYDLPSIIISYEGPVEKLDTGEVEQFSSFGNGIVLEKKLENCEPKFV